MDYDKLDGGAILDGKDIDGSEFTMQAASSANEDDRGWVAMKKYITPDSQGREGKCTAMSVANAIEGTVGGILKKKVLVDPDQIWDYQLDVLKTASPTKGDHLKNAFRAAKKLKSLRAKDFASGEEFEVKLGAYGYIKDADEALKMLRKGYSLGTAMRSYRRKLDNKSIFTVTGKTGVMPQYNSNEWNRGNSAHAFCLVMEGDKLYMVNSWGVSWGNRGKAEVPIGMLENMYYFFVPIVITRPIFDMLGNN